MTTNARASLAAASLGLILAALAWTYACSPPTNPISEYRYYGEPIVVVIDEGGGG